MATVIIILTIALIVEIMFSPRIGFIRENRILLWYGKTKHANKKRFNVFYSLLALLPNLHKVINPVV